MQYLTPMSSPNDANPKTYKIPAYAQDHCVLVREDGILLDYDIQRGKAYLTSSEDWPSHTLCYSIARRLYDSAIPAGERYLWRFYLVKAGNGHEPWACDTCAKEKL